MRVGGPGLPPRWRKAAGGWNIDLWSDSDGRGSRAPRSEDQFLQLHRLSDHFRNRRGLRRERGGADARARRRRARRSDRSRSGRSALLLDLDRRVCVAVVFREPRAPLIWMVRDDRRSHVDRLRSRALARIDEVGGAGARSRSRAFSWGVALVAARSAIPRSWPDSPSLVSSPLRARRRSGYRGFRRGSDADRSVSRPATTAPQ